MKSIERKIKAVEEKVTRLKKISDKVRTLDEYQSSQDLKDICERNLQVAIESCLDIGKMIISANQLQEPKDNKVSVEKASFPITATKAEVRNVLNMLDSRLRGNDVPETGRCFSTDSRGYSRSWHRQA